MLNLLKNIKKNKKYMIFIHKKLITESQLYYKNLGVKKLEVHQDLIDLFINIIKKNLVFGLFKENFDGILKYYYNFSNILTLKDFTDGKLFKICFDSLYDDMLDIIPDTEDWFNELCDTRHEMIDIVKEMGDVYKNYIFKNKLNMLEYEIDQIYFISPIEDLLEYLSSQEEIWEKEFLEKECVLLIEEYYLNALYNPRCELGKKKHNKFYNDSFY